MSELTGSGFVGERLARFVAASRRETLPYPLWHEGKRSLLNFIGCALGVAHTPPIDMALRGAGSPSRSMNTGCFWLR